jgi:hypothetical protein
MSWAIRHRTPEGSNRVNSRICHQQRHLEVLGKFLHIVFLQKKTPTMIATRTCMQVGHALWKSLAGRCGIL